MLVQKYMKFLYMIMNFCFQSEPVYVPINNDDGYSSIDSSDNGKYSPNFCIIYMYTGPVYNMYIIRYYGITGCIKVVWVQAVTASFDIQLGPTAIVCCWCGNVNLSCHCILKDA